MQHAFAAGFVQYRDGAAQCFLRGFLVAAGDGVAQLAQGGTKSAGVGAVHVGLLHGLPCAFQC